MDELLNQITNDPYLYSVKHYKQSAWLGHAPFMKFVVRELKPKSFVELGTHNGFSYFVTCQSIVETGLECKAFAVDHWIGDAQAGYFDQFVYDQVVETNQEYKHFSTLLKMSFSEATEVISNSFVDLLHIDGYHSYESVSEDFYSWLPKMTANGVILLHDIHVRRDSFGVYKLWAEIKKKYKTMEFVGSHGLGVVFLGEVPLGLFAELFEISNSGNLAQIQGTFGSISDSLMQSLLHQESASLLELVKHERDSAITERDSAITERDLIVHSRSWKATKFLRFISNFLR